MVWGISGSVVRMYRVWRLGDIFWFTVYIGFGHVELLV